MQCEHVNDDGVRCCFVAEHFDEHLFAYAGDFSDEIRRRVLRDRIIRLEWASFCVCWVTVAWAMLVGKEST